MKKAPCIHCGILAYPITRGYCQECLESDAPALSAGARAALEVSAAAACRTAGLRAIPRLCDDDRCGCAAEKVRSKRTILGRQRYGGGRRRQGAEFTPTDVVMLERYFEMDLSARWERSNFGAMCERIAEGIGVFPEERKRFRRILECNASDLLDPHVATLDAKTERLEVMVCERTYDTRINGRRVEVVVLQRGQAPFARESEIIFPGPDASGEPVACDENDLARHADLRAEMRLVHAVLAHSPKWVAVVLKARYAASQESASSEEHLGRLAAVALVTRTVMRLRHERAHRLDVEITKSKQDEGAVVSMEGAPTERGTLADLIRRSKDVRTAETARKAAGDMLEQIRHEADALLESAQVRYAGAAWSLV